MSDFGGAAKPLSENPDYKIAILGVPFDEKSSYLRGAAGGPAAVRAVSTGKCYCGYTELGVNLEEDTVLVDLGDVDTSGDPGQVVRPDREGRGRDPGQGRRADRHRRRPLHHLSRAQGLRPRLQAPRRPPLRRPPGPLRGPLRRPPVARLPVRPHPRGRPGRERRPGRRPGHHRRPPGQGPQERRPHDRDEGHPGPAPSPLRQPRLYLLRPGRPRSRPSLRACPTTSRAASRPVRPFRSSSRSRAGSSAWTSSS